jgi:general secretion pathway protein M
MNGLKTLIGNWWSSISPREQKLVMIGSVLLLLGMVYWGLVQPMAERASNAAARIQSEKQLLSWVEDKADEIVSLRKAGGKSASSLPLNQAVSSTTKRFGIELVRVQARSEELQVWISPVEFNKFVDWVAFLQETHGVSVVFLDLDKGEQPGMIEVQRLQFKKG